MGGATEAGLLVRQRMHAGGYKYRISHVLVDHSRVRQQYTEHQVLSSSVEKLCVKHVGGWRQLSRMPKGVKTAMSKKEQMPQAAGRKARLPCVVVVQGQWGDQVAAEAKESGSASARCSRESSE